MVRWWLNRAFSHINSHNPLINLCSRVVTYSENLLSLKPDDPLITWPTRGQVKIREVYISIITRLMASKPGKVLIYGRRFSMQTLKSSLTSCSPCNESKKICFYLSISNNWWRKSWPNLKLYLSTLERDIYH